MLFKAKVSKVLGKDFLGFPKHFKKHFKRQLFTFLFEAGYAFENMGYVIKHLFQIKLLLICVCLTSGSLISAISITSNPTLITNFPFPVVFDGTYSFLYLVSSKCTRLHESSSLPSLQSLSLSHRLSMEMQSPFQHVN